MRSRERSRRNGASRIDTRSVSRGAVRAEGRKAEGLRNHCVTTPAKTVDDVTTSVDAMNLPLLGDGGSRYADGTPYACTRSFRKDVEPEKGIDLSFIPAAHLPFDSEVTNIGMFG
jgi:hypothetical protein